MGLDVGDKWIGIAVSDELRIVPRPLSAVRRTSVGQDILHLLDLCKRWNISQIVVGLPVNMDNSLGPQAQKTLSFISQLRQQFAGAVMSRDERLTTKEAERILIAQDVRRERRKQLIDGVAATLILEGFLQELRVNSEKEVGRVADDKEPNELMGDEDEEIITLTDEDGNEHEFVVVDVIEVDAREYAILLPIDTQEDEETEAVILRLEKDTDGDDVLVDIESESEWDKVAQAYEELLDEDDDE